MTADGGLGASVAPGSPRPAIVAGALVEAVIERDVGLVMPAARLLDAAGWAPTR